MILKRKFARWCTFGFIGISFLISLNVAAKRFSFEQKNRTIDMVVSLQDVDQLAKASGMDSKKLLSELAHQKGITSIAIQEDTIASFIDQGKVTLLKGSDIMNMLRVGKVYRTILTHLTKKTRVKKDRLYLVIDEYELYERIKNYLKLSLEPDSIKERGWNIIEVISNEDTLKNIGLGISEKKVQSVTAYGFSVIPRIRNNALLSDTLILLKLDSLLKQQQNINTIIFDGPSVLGYPHYIETVATQLRKTSLNVGIIEFSNQKGAKALARHIPNKIINVHSISDDTMKKIPPNMALTRYLRSAKERSNRILFLHPFFSYFGGNDLSRVTLDYILQMKNHLIDFGFQLGAIKHLPTTNYFSANTIELLLLSIGVFAWLLLFLNTFFPLQTRHFIMLSTSALLLYSIFLIFQQTMIWNRLMTVLIACIFPAYALIALFPNRISENNIVKRFGLCVTYLAQLLGLSFIGALLIIGFTSDLSFLLKIRQFFGVKISFLIPIVLVGLYFYLRPHRIQSIYFVFRRIFHQPITTASLLAGILSLMVISIYILRSGNYLTIPFIETWMRNTLESLLFIRPRTKEFLIGYPFLIMGYMYIDRTLSRNWLWFFNVIGVVAIISVLNSFCHSHTPITISFFRSILGFLLGITFGAIYLVLFQATRCVFKRLSN